MYVFSLAMVLAFGICLCDSVGPPLGIHKTSLLLFFFYWDSRFITVINGIFPHCCCAEDELVGHVLDDCSGYLADMLLSLARKGG